MPIATKNAGLRTIEVDIYVGPSVSSTSTVGLGFQTAVFGRQASHGSFGTKWGASAGGGLFLPGPGQPTELQLSAGAAFSAGYYSLAGLANGSGPHVLLNALSVGANVITQDESLYAYTPTLEIGWHGRNAATSSNYTTQVRGGLSVNWAGGALAKLGPGGAVVHDFVDPYGQFVVAGDFSLTSRLFLRLVFVASDTLDAIGPAGTRQILQARGNAFVKVGRVLYTGPTILFTAAGRQADFATSSYVAAAPVYSVSWLLGGAI